MKILISIVLGLAFASSSFAQTVAIQNEVQKVRGSTSMTPINGLSVDRYGNQIFPNTAARQSWFQACSSTNISTTDEPIKASTSLYYYYVATFSCQNVSAVPSFGTLKSGSTIMWKFMVPANGSYVTTFPIPIKGDLSSNLQFAMTTTATATNCCISGYQLLN